MDDCNLLESRLRMDDCRRCRDLLAGCKNRPMPTSAFALALAAAFVHALWNVLLARAENPYAATAVALVTAELVFAVPAWLLWNVEREAWPYLVASAALQLVYFALLITA